MPFLAEFITIATIHLLAVMSPGPDFVLISRNSLIYSKKAAIYSALGLAFGIFVHIAYSLIGIGFIIAKSILLFTILKLLSAGYLIYIGYKCLTADDQKSEAHQDLIKEKDLSRSAAIRMGFLTNVFNPKATLFFFALFTQIINPQTPLIIQVLYGLEMSLMTFVWFASVAMILSNQHVKKRFHTVQHRLEKVFGVILIALGIRVAFASSK